MSSKSDIGCSEQNSLNKDSSNKETEPEVLKAFLKAKLTDNSVELIYAIDDNPPWHMAVFLGFQHYLTMFGGTVALPLLVTKIMCIGSNGIAKSQLICTIFFASGIATLLQSTVGTRLPIVQGGTFTFLAPSIAILSLPKWKCPEPPKLPNKIQQSNLSSNLSCWKYVCVKNKTINLPSFLKGNPFVRKKPLNFLLKDRDLNKAYPRFGNNKSSPDPTKHEEDADAWKLRMREIQGAIIVASLLQVVIGATGAMGYLIKYIGPLTIAPSISLLGLSLFDVGADHASTHWGIAIFTMVLVIIFSQYLKNVKMPLPVYSKAKGIYPTHVAMFELFPVLLSVLLAWILCIILTAADQFEPGHPARTDTMVSLLRKAPWFRVPYPGQWGTPTVSVAAVIGMVAGVMAGIIESIGDYYACARMSGAPPVPQHALNRGILIEGLCCMLDGALGSGAGTTSYSENIGAIGITKVGSRRVIQYGGLFMVILAVLGKFGALFATIPEPIVGGVFIIMFGMVTAVGLSNLQFVDLNSTRNLFIIGFSIFIGLVVPKWIEAHGNAIDTGVPVLDQVIFVLLITSMWVGGMVGFFLDITLPGTIEERGILKWREMDQREGAETKTQMSSVHTYDVPFLTPFIQRFPFVRFVPFLPYYGLKSDVEDGKSGQGRMMDNGGEGSSTSAEETTL